ncbi:nodulation protein NfeD [Pusillimonas sp. TS35]|uniref:NfeD family protein n=1 Tax=Paracandidimonas lactea TaxID=2895524 RepID=UPI0013714B1A|nr:nodulation protein NfeD [Paracandidimonas lactea]MYN12114.1 nodulation protein NfeD [Pusillimonas sp. TS35]
MRNVRLLWCFACLLMGMLMAGASLFMMPVPAAQAGVATAQAVASKAAQRELVRVLSLSDIITPASADFVVRGLDDAAKAGAALVVLQLDTPGGLDTSMRSIVRAILASPVPVATFVGPGGARAASAGVFILYASHIAAMAPASNLGAASPVSIGFPQPENSRDKAADGGKGDKGDSGTTAPAGSEADTMTRKVTNDAAAYLRSLAQLRHRNAEFAERAVREATSLSSREALDDNVIDFIANDVPDLLAMLNGRSITLDHGRQVTLRLENAEVQVMEPDWRTRILALIANPQIALVLMMIGIYGLFFELMNPGAVLPGVAGLISLLLALYAFQLLPVNWAGLGLLFAGIIMMVAEVFLPSFGALGVGGIIAFVIGGLMLTDTGIPGFDLSVPFLAGMAVAGAGLIILTGLLAARAARSTVMTGQEAMTGQEGRVSAVTGDMIYADIAGERWRVRATEPLTPGDRVIVRRVEGLTLQVDRLAGRPGIGPP